MANYSPLAAILNHPNVIQEHFQDVASTQQVLVWWLTGKPVDTGAGLKPTAKKFTMELDGGSRFEVPLMLNVNSNMKAFAKDDTFTLTANDLGDRAYYNIRSLGGPIPLYGFDEDVSASSKTNIINVTKAFLEQGSITMLNLLGDQLFRTSAAGANDWNSLFDLIAEDPTADSIGGISAATYDKWRNQYKDATSSSIATYLLPYLTTYRVAATIGTQKPRIVLMTPTLYGKLVGQLVANQRYVPDAELVKAGFDAIQFEGASVMYDQLMPTGSILGINPEALIYGTLKGANMKLRDFVPVPDADVKVAFLKHRGNLCIRDRRTNYNIFDFTTA